MTDAEILERLSRKGGFLRLRFGIFDKKHARVLRGERYRVFTFLCAIANYRLEPKFVAETSCRQIARILEMSRNTAKSILEDLEPQYIATVPGGFFVHNLHGNGNEGRGPTGPLFDGVDHISNTPRSKTDPPVDHISNGGVRKLIHQCSKTDPPNAVNDGNKELPEREDSRRSLEDREDGDPLPSGKAKSKKSWWWDVERQCVAGTDAAKKRLREKVRAEGFSLDWYQGVMADMNRRLRMSPEMKPKSNWTNFVTKWVARQMRWAEESRK